MPTPILMPALSPSMTVGKLGRWLKATGEAVNPGDALVEVETDKATMEVEADSPGVLGDILVAEGTDQVAIGQPIAILLRAGETAGPVTREPANAPVADRAQPDEGGGRVFASPLARRLARRSGLDVARIAGSGPRGRVVRADVEPPLTAPPMMPAPQPLAEPAVASFDAVPNSTMRKVIAQRLAASKRDIPHYYLTIDCNIDALLDQRTALNARAPDTDDRYKLSINDFILRAVALALRASPDVNAEWTEDAIQRHRTVDVSVAVSTPAGLITPVIRNADAKGLAAISTELRDLATKARDGKLRPEEYQGGGFTVSNLGMFEIREFAGIINPPQSSLLAVGQAEERAIVRNGGLAVATMMTCTLSADHRLIDGAKGAQFLRILKRLVEDPLTMLL